MNEPTNPITKAKVVGRDIDIEDYLQQEVQRGDPAYVMTRGDLLDVVHCPERWKAGYHEDGTDSKDWGALMDALVLQPHKFKERWAVTPENYQNDKGEVKPWNWNANACKDWRQQQIESDIPVERIVKATDYQDALTALVKLNSDIARPIIMQSDKQVLVRGEYFDEATQIMVPLKGLIDAVPPLSSPWAKSLVDFKTAASAMPVAWKKAVFQHGYHVQAALYLDLYVKATGEDRCDFRHVVQENYAPWQVGLHLLSQEFLELGRRTYLSALALYCQCLASNEWPGYRSRVMIDNFNLCEPEAWMIG